MRIYKDSIIFIGYRYLSREQIKLYYLSSKKEANVNKCTFIIIW